MAIEIYLGNIHGSNLISSYVDIKKLNITNSNQIKAYTLSFDMVVHNRETRAPEALNTISIIDTLGSLSDATYYVFSGMIESVREEMFNPITFRYTCDAVDWVKIFDRHLVVEKYGGATIKEVIDSILLNYVNTGYENWSPFTYNGGSLDNLEMQETLDFVFVEPSACLDQLAEKSGAQWYISFDKTLYFDRPEFLLIISPLYKEGEGNRLYADTDVISYGDLVLTESIGNLKNLVYVTDAKVKDQNTEEQRFDGAGKANQYYYLGFQLFVPSKTTDLASYIWAKVTDQTTSETTIRNITDIRMDWASKADESEFTMYVNSSTNAVRLPDRFLLGATERLIVTAYKAIDAPMPFPDPASIDLVRERENMGGKRDGPILGGVYEYNRSEPNLWDPDGNGQELAAKQILARYSMPLITGTFTSYLSGWRAGMWFILYSNFRMNGIFKDGVAMYVKSVTKTIDLLSDSMASSRVKNNVSISNNRWEGT